MPEKPKTAEGYPSGQVALVRSTCLTLATKLGNLMNDLVIVGGLVPSLIVDATEDVPAHVGTLDLDVGLQLALLDDQHYRTLTQRLRDSGFKPDINVTGNLTRQRWS